ncbi:MAG: hypothetical protein OEZ22_14405 [Spirochaetia bacterium]|nr:hypothetical protein [Spirochaetia bacterium]
MFRKIFQLALISIVFLSFALSCSAPLLVTTIETAAINVDGDDSDWANISYYHYDPANDQSGTLATDLTKFNVATDGMNMFLLMKTQGSMAFPHTPDHEFSHYTVFMDLYEDSECEGGELGFIGANNITDSVGTISNQIDNWVDNTPLPIIAVSLNNILEFSFALNVIPPNVKSVTFNPTVNTSDTSYDDFGGNINYCYVLP